MTPRLMIVALIVLAACSAGLPAADGGTGGGGGGGGAPGGGGGGLAGGGGSGGAGGGGEGAGGGGTGGGSCDYGLTQPGTLEVCLLFRTGCGEVFGNYVVPYAFDAGGACSTPWYNPLHVRVAYGSCVTQPQTSSRWTSDAGCSVSVDSIWRENVPQVCGFVAHTIALTFAADGDGGLLGQGHTQTYGETSGCEGSLTFPP